MIIFIKLILDSLKDKHEEKKSVLLFAVEPRPNRSRHGYTKLHYIKNSFFAILNGLRCV